MFVCAKRGGEVTPVGTTFQIGVPAERKGAWTYYFVTANHVVQNGTPRWIRFRRHDGGPPEDREVTGWVPHPTADLAIAPCDLDDTDAYIANYQEEEYFCDKFPPGVDIMLGERAYFMGLLAEVESMAERALPMMRAAIVGALYAENVPMRSRLADGTVHTHIEPKAHLIDTYSRSGFSGSPVYVEHPYVNMMQVDEERLGVQLTGFSPLFGVLVGHFGTNTDNAGIGVVVPVDAIRDVLADPDLVDWRKRKEDEMEARRQELTDENVAIADDVPPESELGRFDALASKLMKVPKSEIDTKRKEEESRK
jgi:hypothetical protein